MLGGLHMFKIVILANCLDICMAWKLFLSGYETIL